MPTEGQKSKAQFEEFASEATVHGLNKVADTSSTLWRRCLWLLVLLFMLSCLIAIIVMSVQRFWSYPFLTSVTLEAKPNLTLPSITVCNNNGLRKSVIDSNPLAKEFFAHRSRLGFVKHGEVSSETTAWTKETDGMEFFWNGMVPADEFIFNCTFVLTSGVLCPEVQRAVMPTGFCHTLTLPPNLRTVALVGASGMFGFHVNVQADEYSSEAMSKAIGAKIAVHRTGMIPSTGEMLSVSPGSEVQLALAQKENVRLGKPYNDDPCTEGETYTKAACLFDCYNKNTHEMCGCSLNETNGSEETYTSDACGCAAPCEEVTYDVQMSQMTYPSEHAAHIMQHDVDYLRKNVIAVQMYFRTMDVEKTEQKPDYTLSDLGADIGGYMGLFLGASVISISELLEFLAALCYAKCSANSKTRSQIVQVASAKH